jgi:ferredoxin-NADP reductase/(2Fe-2S) ferredoxin
MVIYPEGVWYTYNSEADIDEILQCHVLGGERVERLLLESGQTRPRPTDPLRLTLQVADVSLTAPAVKRFVLRSLDGSDLPAYPAGAHIDLFTEPGLRRSYSLVGDPADRRQYVLGVRREEDSRGGSSWVFDQLSANSEVTASVPRNSFALAADATMHTLIAGGIGITPILAMGHELKARSEDYHLHYCTPNEVETPFLEEVRSVFGPKVTFHHDDGNPAKGLDVQALLADSVPGQHIYVCGPASLVESARLHSSHWPEETFHSELFAVELVTDELPNEVFDVFLSRQKITLSVPPERSILEVVRDAGLAVETSCEDGLCSCCRTRLLGGEADHRDHVLSSAEKLANESIMICVSRATDGETLILDL